MDKPLTDAELDALALAHAASQHGYCCMECGADWPCVVSELAEELRALGEQNAKLVAALGKKDRQIATLKAALKGLGIVPRVRLNSYDAAWKKADAALASVKGEQG